MKRIDPDQVEVINADGSHVAGQKSSDAGVFTAGNFKMVKLGPVGALISLLALPILLPLFLLGFLILLIPAMIFGKTVFKSGMSGVIRKF